MVEKKKKRKTTSVEDASQVAEAEPAEQPIVSKKSKKKKKKAAAVEASVAPNAEQEERTEVPKKKRKASDDAEGDIAAPAPKAPKLEDLDPLKIFVGGVPRTTEESAVRSHFEKLGTLEEFRFPLNKRGIAMGFAFITFKSPKAAKEALKLNGSSFQGSEISVKMQDTRERTPKPEKPKEGVAEAKRDKPKGGTEAGNHAGGKNHERQKGEGKGKGKGTGKGKDKGNKGKENGDDKGKERGGKKLSRSDKKHKEKFKAFGVNTGDAVAE